MRPRSLRRACGLHPRAVLVVLLAFAIEIVPLPGATARHRHGGGDAPHVHAGWIAGMARSDRAGGDVHGTAMDGGRAAAGIGLYQLNASVVVGTLPAIVPLVSPTLVSPLPSFVLPGSSPVGLAPGGVHSSPDQPL